MTQAAQSALRRGASADPPEPLHRSLAHASDRTAHQECPILHSLQLRQQNHTRYPITVYAIQVLALTREGGRKEGRRGNRKGRARLSTCL